MQLSPKSVIVLQGLPAFGLRIVLCQLCVEWLEAALLLSANVVLEAVVKAPQRERSHCHK